MQHKNESAGNYGNPLTAFTEGTEIDLGSVTVSKEEIIEFAEEFDPAPFHLDEEAARNSILGGLAASGFQTCGLAMSMVCNAFLLSSTSQGSPGIEEVKWLSPLFAGDTLSGVAKVFDQRQSRSRPDVVIARFNFRFHKQTGEPVLEWTNPIMFTIPKAA